MRRVREELHGHSILGVSNISFGLPQREVINAFFFTMALQNGLDCAIINPNSIAMMASYRAFLALSGQDPQCGGFIRAYGNPDIPGVFAGKGKGGGSGAGSAGSAGTGSGTGNAGAA